MKKLLLSLISAFTLFTSANAQDLYITSTVGYESNYVFRGAELADDIVQGEIDLSFFELYAGLWIAQPLQDSQNNEVDLYAGYGFAASDLVIVDFGGTLYHYPEAKAGEEDTTYEVKIGAVFDLMFKPAAYLFYDFELEIATLETSAGHSVTLSDSTYLDFGAYIGYIEPDNGNSQYYLGATADISHSFSETASGAIGVRVSDLEDGDTLLYWGASFTAGF